MKMLTMIDTRWALVAPLGLLVASCGGGGGGTSVPTGIPGNDGPSIGGACDNAYYREIIGTYKGSVVYQSTTSAGEAVVHCEWELKARIEIERELAVCSLRMDTSSTVTQSVVLSGDDPQRHECQAENGVRNLFDPNSSSDPSRFEDVNFPVFMDFRIYSSVPQRGPYFGDPSVDAPYLYLFDGLANLADSLRFDGVGGISLSQRSLSAGTGFSGTLSKE